MTHCFQTSFLLQRGDVHVSVPQLYQTYLIIHSNNLHLINRYASYAMDGLQAVRKSVGVCTERKLYWP